MLGFDYFNCFQNKLFLLICIILQIRLSFEQTTAFRRHVNKCLQYKSEVYEKTYSFSVLMYDAPEMNTVVDNCRQFGPFIVGGSPAKPKEFPHMARLGRKNDEEDTIWFCGGTLISLKFVLTAAHCFFSDRGEVNRVRLGELVFNSISDDARPEDFDIKNYLHHPSYNNDNSYNDIGLVELSREVTLSDYIAPACLPEKNGDEFDRYYAVGWGSTKFAQSDSDALYKVCLDRFDSTKCRQFTDNSANMRLTHGLEDDTQICAGSDQAKDTCNGDSGGPLLQYHGEYACMYYVVGITSTGIGCGLAGIPGVYTRVFNYIDWIEKTVWK